MDDDFEDEEIPTMSRSSTEAFMEEGPSSSSHSRRNEDIALDLMKFVAMTTGYGRTTSTGVGFQGTGGSLETRRVCQPFARAVRKVRGSGGREKVNIPLSS